MAVTNRRGGRVVLSHQGNGIRRQWLLGVGLMIWLTQLGKNILEIPGERGCHRQALTANRMVKCNLGCVQEGTGRRGPGGSAAIDTIANDRVVDRGQVDSDLMGPTCLQTNTEQRALHI